MTESQVRGAQHPLSSSGPTFQAQANLLAVPLSLCTAAAAAAAARPAIQEDRTCVLGRVQPTTGVMRIVSSHPHFHFPLVTNQKPGSNSGSLSSMNELRGNSNRRQLGRLVNMGRKTDFVRGLCFWSYFEILTEIGFRLFRQEPVHITIHTRFQCCSPNLRSNLQKRKN